MSELALLESESIREILNLVGTPTAIRQILRSQDEVQRVRENLKQGGMGPVTIKSYVRKLLGDLQAGTQFPHEAALCALAVVVEELPTDFAAEFLQELSRVDIMEMPLSPRVARECLQARRCTKTVSRTVNVESSDELCDSFLESFSLAVTERSPCEFDSRQPYDPPAVSARNSFQTLDAEQAA